MIALLKSLAGLGILLVMYCLAWDLGGRLSSDAISMLVGMIFMGVLIVPVAVVVALAARQGQPSVTNNILVVQPSAGIESVKDAVGSVNARRIEAS